MKPRTKSAVFQLAGIAIAGGLLYLALRNVDFGGMWRALQQANYWWFIPLIVVTLGAHFLRAWRWRMFLDALPESESGGRSERVTLKVSFYAVMIGYLLNLVVPRLGEIARTANLSSQTGLRFSSVFGTVVIERLLDFVALLIILVGVGFVLIGSPAADALVFSPLKTRLTSLTIADYLVAVATMAVFIGFILWLPRLLRSREGRGAGLAVRLAPILRSFRLGFITLFTSPHRTGILLTTIGIWTGYWLMLYLPMYMLRMTDHFGLDALSGFVLLGIGSIGFVLPAPGGIGSYHYFVIETFVQIYDVPYDVAAGFAVLTHAAQVVLLTAVGFWCVAAQGSSLGRLLKSARDIETDSPDRPIFENPS